MLRHASGYVDRDRETKTVPVHLEQHEQLLRAPDCKRRDEHLASNAHGGMHQLQQVCLSAALRLADRGRVGGLGDEHVRLESTDLRGAEMPVRHRVEVARVHHTMAQALCGDHYGAHDVPGVVGAQAQLVVYVNRLAKRDESHLAQACVHIPSTVRWAAALARGREHVQRVLEQDRRHRCRRPCHVDGAIVAKLFGEEGQGAAVIEVEVRDDHAIDRAGERAPVRTQLLPIWETTVVMVAHVHAAVEHDAPPAKRDHHAAATYVLASTEYVHLDSRAHFSS